MSGVKGKSGGKRKGAGRKPMPLDTLYSPELSEMEICQQREKVEEQTVSVIKTAKPTIEIEQENEFEKPKNAKEHIIRAMNTCEMKELKCPIEFELMPYAKNTWDYVIELDKNSKYHLLNERHFECLKSYCLAVEVRQRLIESWEKQNKAMLIYSGKEMKINPIVKEISTKSNQINKFAEDLGLTILSEFKMAEMSAKNKDDDNDNDDGMFD